MDPRLSRFRLGSLLFQAKTPEDLEILIKEYGVDPNVVNDAGFSVLRTFVNTDRLDMVETLLINKTNANIREDDGETPIFGVKSVEMIELLAKYGANLNHKDNNDNSPAHVLRKVDDSKILAAFERLGCDMTNKNYEDMTPSQIRETVKRQKSVCGYKKDWNCC